jgi:glycosyltransferase involved in cell wall biosynthesis
LSKDPETERGGDLDTSRAVMRLAAEVFEVSAVCLSSEEPGTSVVDLVPGGLTLTRVRKPPMVPHRLLIAAARSRRSIVHTRFDVDALLPAIDACDADVFVAEHSYMAETFLRSMHFGAKRLIINTINTESQVWRASRGVLGTLLWRSILRDELRVARAADAVGTYDADEAEFYRRHGVLDARWIDLTAPPAAQLDIAASAPRLVCLGRRDWPPNQEAFLEALRLWPRIAAGLPEAELCVVGSKKPGTADPVYPPGVRDLGFVDDLDEFLGTCRALMAPVRTGGGLRAKLLDAASRGLPVIATSAAIGSLGQLFELPAHDTDEDFVATCRRYLLDSAAAAAEGTRLFEQNREHWALGRPERSVQQLINAASPSTGLPPSPLG